LLKRGQDLRAVAGGSGGGTAKQKRFWKDVHVKKVDGKISFTRPYIYPLLS
jgi:ATP synthase F1 complex assembly factor 2